MTPRLPGHARRATLWLPAAVALLPWLNPFAPGPSPSVGPWLLSATCAIVLAGLAAAQGGRPRGSLFAASVATVLWASFVTGARPEVVMLLGGLAVVVLASTVPADDLPHSAAAGVQWAWLLAACASAVVGLVQYFGASGPLQPWINGAAPGEAYGNLRQPNLFATLCSIGIAVLLWGGVRLRFGLALAAVALLAAGSAASVSRTGAVQGLLLAALAAWWGGPARSRRLALCAAGAGAYLLASWALPLALEAMTGTLPARTFWGRVSGGAVAACSSRTVLWSNVLHLVTQKPLVGWGWGELDYAHFETLYPGARFCDILDNAHNLPLHLAVELGVPFAVLACGVALWWASRQRPWAEAAPLRQLAWALVAIVMLHALLEYPLWYGPFQVVLGVALGWLLRPAGAREAGRPVRPLLVALPLLLVPVAYAAWDYARVSQIYVAPAERRAAWREDTLGHVRRSWLFAGQARFADLTLQEVTPANAASLLPLAREVLHYSPEARVIERVIESETALGRTDEAVRDLARFRAAFPRDYEAWRKGAREP